MMILPIFATLLYVAATSKPHYRFLAYDTNLEKIDTMAREKLFKSRQHIFNLRHKHQAPVGRIRVGTTTAAPDSHEATTRKIPNDVTPNMTIHYGNQLCSKLQKDCYNACVDKRSLCEDWRTGRLEYTFDD